MFKKGQNRVILLAVIFLAVLFLSGCQISYKEKKDYEKINYLEQKIKELEVKVAEQQRIIDEQKISIESFKLELKNNTENINQESNDALSKMKACDQVFYYENQYKVKNRDDRYTNFVKCENSVIKCRDQKGWIRNHYKNDNTYSEKDIEFILNQIERDYQVYLKVKKLCDSQ